MDEYFQALSLDSHRATVAYPLIYMYDASITTEQWLRFVRRRCRSASGGAGLIAIRDRRGVVHALFSYRVDIDLRVRKRLCIADLIVAHLPGSKIDAAVAASAAHVSAQFDCQMITIEQPIRSTSCILAAYPITAALNDSRASCAIQDPAGTCVLPEAYSKMSRS